MPNGERASARNSRAGGAPAPRRSRISIDAEWRGTYAKPDVGSSFTLQDNDRHRARLALAPHGPRQVLDLNQAFQKIEDTRVRRQVGQLVKSLDRS